MIIRRIVIIGGIVALLCLCSLAFAQDTIKWSAPMQLYPNPWTPTAPPPSYYNPWGYQYPYAAYGYGAYYGGYSPNAYQGYSPGAYQGGQNPAYNYYYGQ